LPPEPAAAPDDEERLRAHLAAALFAFVAAVQLLLTIVGPRDLVSYVWRIVFAVAAGFLARIWWRGRRPRLASIAYALLWSALNVIAAVELVRYTPVMWAEMNASTTFQLAVPTIPGWFIPLFAATSTSFIAVTIVIVTGRPSKARRIVGAALGAVFALLFLAEHLYQVR
jgi:hypothetical protein